ncbi:coiled-coil domain-containing protein 66 isoform X3 [Channa argus]|uniref:coiled-coil domain-containing protein 66 isoform X3 n=1 Tax=Channa argus TaxID=215402 RepID=UPI00351FF7C5
MNLGDGLLFELENGKPKLILLSHGVDKNPKKLSFRPRVANILSSRQPSCVEEVQEERPAPQQAGRRRETKSRAERVNTPFTSSTVTSVGKSTTLTLSKTHEHSKGGTIKTVAKVKSERQRHNTNVGALRASGKTGQHQRSVPQGSGKDLLASGDSMVCLTNKQLQQILSTVQNLNNGKHTLEDHRTQDVGDYGNQTNSKSGNSMTGSGGEMKQEDRGGGKEIKNKGGGGEVSDTTRSPPDKDNRSSGCLFSWLEERQSDSRATLDARKAQWRRELDEQVALKQQQRSDPGRLQAEEDRESVLSVRSSISHREQPAGIKSSLKLGEVTPMEEALSVERRKEQSRRWLEELDRQRDEMNERRRREKVLQSQTEDHELWATHFDSLQKKPPVQTAAPAPSSGSERREWEPLSRLSLVGEATSSVGAESVCAATVDTTKGIHQSKPSYLRTMTALLDPAQIEERERRRLKQLEQQRAIDAQVEERRRQREQEEARRREKEEEEERRVKQEMDILQRQYELALMRERQKVREQHTTHEQLNLQEHQTNAGHNAEGLQETLEPSTVTRKHESEEVVSNLVPPYKDTAVQTEATCSLPLGAKKAQSSPPRSAAPPNSRSRALRTGKENICLPGGKDPYEAFARTERNQKDKKRPEWNAQRPSCQFVPASERYPAALQRNREETRLKRQAKLLALQERACLSRTDPPSQTQEPRLCSNPAQSRTSPTRKVESISGGQNTSATITIKRGRSPPIPAVRHKVQSQHASSPSPPVLEFIPYVRTEEAFNLDPLEHADTPHPDTGPPQSSASLPASSHRDPLLHPELLCNTPSHRQQEILRGLAQLRQGLLQTQRELETDLNPLLKRHDNEFPLPSATHHM